jgi:hypothetical protein
MSKKATLLTVHGMGETPRNFDEQLKESLQKRLGQKYQDLHVGSIYYQAILQTNEERVWKSLSEHVRWPELRKFLLYGFADAAGLESNKTINKSDYWQVQALIAQAMLTARNAMGGDGPVVILALSLGCQVISCYFWDADAQNKRPTPYGGIWHEITTSAPAIQEAPLTPEEIAFLRGSTFKHFITTGCNIPIFVAAHAKNQILPMDPSPQLKWDNYYDKDDVLGWPLQGLSDEYANAVQDHPINVSSGVIDALLHSWNPLSHTQYWADNDVLDALENALVPLL